MIKKLLIVAVITTASLQADCTKLKKAQEVAAAMAESSKPEVLFSTDPKVKVNPFAVIRAHELPALFSVILATVRSGNSPLTITRPLPAAKPVETSFWSRIFGN